MSVVRVPTAKFKYNMRPYVKRAKAGQKIIVTRSGKDDFQVVPCEPAGAPPVSLTPLDPKLFAGIDLDEPAFESWENDESAP